MTHKHDPEKCMHTANPAYDRSTMIMTIVKGEKWAICKNCRIGWNKAQFEKDRFSVFGL